MTDKKKSENSLTVKRIIIFCVFAYIPFLIIMPILNADIGEMLFVSENGVTAAYVLGVFGMFIPLTANVLTRLITKEGFKTSYLGFFIEEKKKYYIIPIAVKIFEALICTILIWALFSGGLSFGEAFPFDDVNKKVGLFLYKLALSIIMFFPALGEEIGWRGYLMPKLTKVIGTPAAVFVGGIIWGLWYAPLIISGQNFGIDYSFYPWFGIILMCVMCIFMNAFLTLITERSHSIYPAVFCRMIHNNLSAQVMLSLFGSEALIYGLSDTSSVTIFLVCLPLSAIIGTVSFILLMKKH